MYHWIQESMILEPYYMKHNTGGIKCVMISSYLQSRRKEPGRRKFCQLTHRSFPAIFRAMASLKHKRNSVAHPPVSVRVAEQTVMTDSIKGLHGGMAVQAGKRFYLISVNKH